jgi:HSP20 family molecular chaperone IbpA
MFDVIENFLKNLDDIQVMQYDFNHELPVYRKLSNSFPFKKIYYNEKSDLIFEFALSGYSKDDISVVLEKYKMVVSAEGQNKINENEKIIHNDLKICDFSIVYSIPEDYDVNTVKSDYKDGILKITFKKNPDSKLITVKID